MKIDGSLMRPSLPTGHPGGGRSPAAEGGADDRESRRSGGRGAQHRVAESRRASPRPRSSAASSSGAMPPSGPTTSTMSPRIVRTQSERGQGGVVRWARGRRMTGCRAAGARARRSSSSGDDLGDPGAVRLLGRLAHDRRPAGASLLPPWRSPSARRCAPPATARSRRRRARSRPARPARRGRPSRAPGRGRCAGSRRGDVDRAG